MIENNFEMFELFSEPVRKLSLVQQAEKLQSRIGPDQTDCLGMFRYEIVENFQIVQCRDDVITQG